MPNTQVEEKIEIKISPIKLYDVIFLNDDYTPMDFVVRLLTDVFNHSVETAAEIMMKVHTNNSAVVATYVYEIADEKRNLCMYNATRYNYPLQVEISESSSEA